MGVTDSIPDADPPVQCALKIDAVNYFMCHLAAVTEKGINRWQKFLFEFGTTMASTFHIDVATKIHRLMMHVSHHLKYMGCVYRGSSQEKETLHKQFKSGYANKNLHLDTIGPRLLRQL